MDFIEGLISGTFPFILTVFFGGYLTLKTGFFQLRQFFSSIKILSVKGDGKASFGAMCNSLAAAIGTGNIVGVAAAISLGGAGAVFWMWVSAMLGMVIKSGEIAVGIFYREKKGEEYVGGPHYYIKNALPKSFSFLGVIFAFFGIIASFFCGNITQINSAVSSVPKNAVIRLTAGIIIAVIIFFVIGGGVLKIIRFLEKMLPFMALLYILLCLGVIVRNINELPSAFYEIFVGAFNPRAVTGGCVGSVLNVISIGASKGIFSNEAGLGTAAVAHSTVKDATPQKQSLFGIFEVFVDTILICTLTALTILTSGVIIDYESGLKANLTLDAFSTVYGKTSYILLLVMLLLFGVSSVIGWASYGINFTEFLFGKKGIRLFLYIYPAVCVVGAVANTEFVWRLAEVFNGVLVIINLFGMIYLSNDVIDILKENKNDKTKDRKAKRFFKK